MALVSKSIPNLINGISQQPPALRLESQGEIQENGLSDVVDGLKKRPPSKFLKKFVKTTTNNANLSTGNTSPLDVTNCFITTYQRSQTEQYTVVIEPHNTAPIIYVYDINGNLNYQSDKASWDWSTGEGVFITGSTRVDDTSYLAGSTITKEDITATSVADATFIVNKKKVVAKSAAVDPLETGHKALVYLKSVNYSRNYKIKVTSKTTATEVLTATASTGNGDANNVSDQEELRVGTVISKLRGETGSGGFLDDPNMISSGVYGSATRTFGATEYINYYDLGDIKLNDTSGISSVSNKGVVNIKHPTNGAFPSSLTLIVGGSVIPYSSSEQSAVTNASATDLYEDFKPSNGWVFNPHINSNATGGILLPISALHMVGGYGSVGARRSSAEIYDISANVYNANILPSTNDNLPYFVISTTETGQIGDFNIEASDDDGGTNLRVFKDNAKSFTDLPNQCIDGFRIAVVGDNNRNEDDFYVQYIGSGGSGVWKETVKANLQNNFDLTTMPHTLKQLTDSKGKL